MKRLLLAGGGHVLVLREIARRRMTDVEIVVVAPSNQLRYSGMLPGWIAGHYQLEELTIDLVPLAQAAGAARDGARDKTRPGQQDCFYRPRRSVRLRCVVDRHWR